MKKEKRSYALCMEGLMQQHNIICIGGPSGAGKDTVATAFLAKHPKYVRVPRSTTRRPRKGEEEGLHYHFLSDDEFERKASTGDIVAIDTFCGESYGIDLRNIRTIAAKGKGIVGVFGICSVELRNLLEEPITLVYIAAPIPFLEERLKKRGDPLASVHMRLSAAKDQLETEPHHFDYLVWNIKDIEDTLSELTEILGLGD